MDDQDAATVKHMEFLVANVKTGALRTVMRDGDTTPKGVVLTIEFEGNLDFSLGDYAHLEEGGKDD